MDTVCLKSGISGIAPAMLIGGPLDVNSHPSQVSAVGRSTTEKSSHTSVFPKFSFKYPLKSLWTGGSGNSMHNRLAFDNAVLEDNMKKKPIDDDDDESGPEDQNKSWFFQLWSVKSLWTGDQGKVEVRNEGIEGECPIDDRRNESGDADDECDVCTFDDHDEADFQFDRESFSRMLRRVSLTEARLHAQFSNLGNLAYSIPKIKPENLLRCYGLRFVTSSLDKTKLATTTGKNEASTDTQEVGTNEKDHGERNGKNNTYHVSVDGDSLERSSDNSAGDYMLNTKVSSVKVTADSVTEVVAAKEEVKQAVADDLNSTSLSPCEWYTCDDDQSGTRFLFVQGFDVLVHRDIYEATKGIYQQTLPEVHDHLKSRGSFAKFRFTGHSLGGSLALLVNLTLLIGSTVLLSASSNNVWCSIHHVWR